MIKALSERFNTALDDQCVFAKTGQIVDASFVEVPRQRNSRDENEQIKQHETPEAWKQKPNKHRQKDVDARWAKKNKMNFYGYKNHLKANKETMLIITSTVTSASLHDSQALEYLINEADAGTETVATSVRKQGSRNAVWKIKSRRKAPAQRS